MGRRKSPLRVKAEAAIKRERTITLREHRDDGFLRRTELEAHTAYEVRANSRNRKIYLSKYWRLKHEKYIRRRMDDAAVEGRETLMPLAGFDCHVGSGLYQEPDE